MTDPLSTNHSHLAHPVPPKTLETIIPAGGHIDPSGAVAVSEEPDQDFTLKCICGFVDAEQNTVYCETCDTWQHTECYYIDATGSIPTNEQLEHIEHYCVDCFPRNLDAKGATARQKARQVEFELNEKKIRKNAAKSHKKKAKATDANDASTNGWIHGAEGDGSHERTSRSPRDNPPTSKRPKASHRASNSTTVTAASYHAPSTTVSSHKRAVSHVPSPAKPPHRRVGSGDEGDLYSAEFLKLYDNDPGDTPLQTNLLNDIHITSDLSLWSNDIEALRKATTKFSHRDIFQRTEVPISSMPMAVLHKQEKVAEDISINGRHPKWIYLTIDSPLPKGGLVGEIKGKIGHMTEYIQNPANRWEYLRHPAPFVFFHPRLPIYIDTRSEGTKCRYLRRSCSPNLVMNTFLENGSEYHFCFVAQCDLDAGSELTIGWVPDANMRRFFDPNHNGAKQETGADEEYIADWASKVLPDFGGCACGSARCTWARFSKRGHGSSKSRNGYAKHAAAGSSANHVSTSREGSDQDDRRSLSDSKSASRDITPMDVNGADSMFAPGTEISAREKRKIAALEKNFEQLENDKHQPAVKKKKRNSGGPNSNGSTVTASKYPSNTINSTSQPTTPSLPSRSTYTDNATSGRRSGSPANRLPSTVSGRSRAPNVGKSRPNLPAAGTISALPSRKAYVDHAVQTDEQDDGQPLGASLAVVPAKKTFISMTKRLLIRSQQERQIVEQKRRASQEAQILEAKSNVMRPPGTSLPDSNSHQVDVPMLDVSLSNAPEVKLPPQSESADPPTVEQASELEAVRSVVRSPTLRPPPNLDQPHDMNSLSSTDPHTQPPQKPPDISPIHTTDSPLAVLHPHSPSASSTITVNSQSVQPSPVTKKLSLSEYIRRKGSTSVHDKASGPSSELQQAALKLGSGSHSGGINGDSRTMAALEENAIMDSPRREIADPLGTSDANTSTSRDPAVSG